METNWYLYYLSIVLNPRRYSWSSRVIRRGYSGLGGYRVLRRYKYVHSQQQKSYNILQNLKRITLFKWPCKLMSNVLKDHKLIDTVIEGREVPPARVEWWSWFGFRTAVWCGCRIGRAREGHRRWNISKRLLVTLKSLSWPNAKCHLLRITVSGAREAKITPKIEAGSAWSLSSWKAKRSDRSSLWNMSYIQH